MSIEEVFIVSKRKGFSCILYILLFAFSEEWFALQNLVKSKSLDLLSCDQQQQQHQPSGSSSENGTTPKSSKTASDSESEGSDTIRYSEAQDIFRKEVSSSFKKLLALLEVDDNSSLGHR